MTNSQEPDDDLYYFETDHLALRDNKDYSEVLKTLVILLSQRERAIKDYNLVVKLKKEALEDPVQVLEKITKGESLGIPDLHCVPELPVIDWSKYSVKVPKDSLDSIYSEGQDKTNKNNVSITPRKEIKVSQGKWTMEEQKRLEELLQIHPPEPVEMRRFQKIADALGNRTLPQVASRVQKYFVKLYKAGLPIPGRIPKAAEKYKKAPSHKHQRHNHYLFKPTTFFPELCVPVLMNDSDCVPGPSNSNTGESAPINNQPSSSSNYLMPGSYHHQDDLESTKSEIELQLNLLRKIRQDKLRSLANNENQHHHLGFKCDYCNDEPISGTRWHCTTCKNDSVDFCTDCVLSQMHSDNCHPLNHNLAPFVDDNPVFSDSESNCGSTGVNNNENSSDISDFDQEEMSDDEEMADRVDDSASSLTQEVMGVNGNFDNRSTCVDGDVSKDDGFASRRGGDDDEFFCDDIETSELFTEIENVSYDYLHSGLLFDKE